MTKTEHKNLSSPDETRSFEHGKVEIINIGEGTVGRLTLEPGWRWSQATMRRVRRRKSDKNFTNPETLWFLVSRFLFHRSFSA